MEDNFICQRIIQEQLLNLGYEVETADDAITALKTIQENVYSLILTDLCLPDKPGIEIIKFVRQSEKYKKIPLILGSAQLSEKDIPKYINLGADAVLIKPYSTEKLSCTVNNLLQ
ncbi:response regulator [Rickettsiella massiliensis]|uniref:response regulator n=1 Tax=Rickettsiella massiliensis TaxID=676517 RepID=UPI00030A04CC|nr:response regulator [Rickettsiella massiliensis]